MAIISGTFTGTDTSASVKCRLADISLSFAGTATVQLQRRIDGTNWRTVGSDYTATTEFTYEAGSIHDIRLNCSAHTNDVTYAIRTTPGSQRT